MNYHVDVVNGHLGSAIHVDAGERSVVGFREAFVAWVDKLC